MKIQPLGGNKNGFANQKRSHGEKEAHDIGLEKKKQGGNLVHRSRKGLTAGGKGHIGEAVKMGRGFGKRNRKDGYKKEERTFA